MKTPAYHVVSCKSTKHIGRKERKKRIIFQKYLSSRHRARVSNNVAAVEFTVQYIAGAHHVMITIITHHYFLHYKHEK